MKNKKKYHRECVYCGKTFYTNIEKQKICGERECKIKVFRENNIKKGIAKEPEKKICVICNKSFLTARSFQKTCSTECRKKYIKNDYKKRFTHEYRLNHGQFNFYKIRFEILQRDGFRCQYCGMTPQDGIRLNVDHINPKANGGTNNKDNLITSCEICNLGKADVLLEQHSFIKMKDVVIQNSGKRD